jgi:glycosyltransferase involved in cell wall biosynthesis
VPKLSVTVITRDEASDIAAALESVKWADEIVVVDSESTDRTVAIAHEFTDRVVVRPWPGYVEQKNFAAAQASHDWILSLDADERITPALAEEMRTRSRARRTPRIGCRGSPGTWAAGSVRRTGIPTTSCGSTIGARRSGPAKYVHESVAVDGSIGRLRGEIQHYAYRDIADHLETIDRYTTYAARQMRESGRTAGLLQLAGHPPSRSPQLHRARRHS